MARNYYLKTYSSTFCRSNHVHLRFSCFGIIYRTDKLLNLRLGSWNNDTLACFFVDVNSVHFLVSVSVQKNACRNVFDVVPYLVRKTEFNVFGCMVRSSGSLPGCKVLHDFFILMIRYLSDNVFLKQIN